MWIETHKTEPTPPSHNDVVIARVLVVLGVVLVKIFIRLNAKQRVPDQPPVVHATTVIAHAVLCVDRLVMHEVGEVAIEEFTHAELNAPPVFNFRVLGKFLAKTAETHAVVF